MDNFEDSCQSCGSALDIPLDTVFTTEFRKDLPQMSDVIELYRSIPAACGLLGIKSGECAVFSEGCRRAYFNDKALRDTPKAFAGNCGTMPFVFSIDGNRPASMGDGITLYEISPNGLKYAIVSYSKGYRYSPSYIIVSKKDAKALFEHFAKQNEEYNKKQLIDHPPASSFRFPGRDSQELN